MAGNDQCAFLAAVEPAIRQAMVSYRVPGIVVAAQRADGTIYEVALGVDTTGHPLEANTLFPVASITKLATALAVLRLISDGRFALDDRLAALVPTAAAAQPGVTMRRLLSHSAGLPLDLPPGLADYAPGLDWPALARACRETPLEYAPGTRVQYSNVGYGLLACVVEKVTGHEFTTVLQRTVLDPLGVEGSLAGPLPRPPAVVADVRGSAARTSIEPFNSAFWHSLGLPWAGLVTSAYGALSLVRAYGSRSTILPPSLRDEATSNQDDDLPGGFATPLVWPACWWGLGPDLRDHKSPHWTPPESSPNTFGHSGASGCCVWDDPTRDLRWAILGTRTADNGWILRAGPRIATAVISILSQ